MTLWFEAWFEIYIIKKEIQNKITKTQQKKALSIYESKVLKLMKMHLLNKSVDKTPQQR